MAKKSTIFNYHAGQDSCGYWRLIWPGMVMSMRGKAQVFNSSYYIRDFAYYSYLDLVRIQRQGAKSQLEFYEKLLSMRDKYGFKLSYEIDDLIFYEDIPKYNVQYDFYENEEFRESAQKLIELCDHMTVPSEAMKEYYLNKTGQKDVRVIPNYLPHFWIGNYYSEHLLVHNFEKYQSRPRIVYMGSGSHVDAKRKGIDDDFSHVKEVMEQTRREFCWTFFGVAPFAFKSYFESGEMEFHPWVSLLDYPKYLSSLNAQMFVAPLQDNTFNRCKSNIKYLEASALGIPIALQDLEPYKNAPIRFKDGREMVQKIRETLSSKDNYLNYSREARRSVEEYWLESEENIQKHIDLI